MAGWGGRHRLAALFGLGIAVAGCSAADKFGDRGVEYNAQILESQNKTILLNIVRASLRHPLAFTSLATVSGTASVSGQLGFNLPFVQNMADNAYFGANPQATVSGGPTFTVNNLDTQEFTQGILKPISMQVIDYYLQDGIPPEIIYYLLIGKVVISGDNDTPIAEIHNSPEVADGFASFQSFISATSKLKLRTEKVDREKDIGPRLSARDLAGLSPMITADQAGLEVATLDVGTLPSEEAAPFKEKHIRQVYQLRKVSPDYRFCFDLSGDRKAQFAFGGISYFIEPSPDSLCGAANQNAPGRKGKRGSGDAKTGTAQNPTNARDFEVTITRLDGNALSSSAQKFEIYPRSTEGAIYYLGELVRYQSAAGSPISVSAGGGQAAFFNVHAGEPLPNTLVSVSYLDRTYNLGGANGDNSDRSAEVFNILTQLINLNKSAKDVPAASVVTLVGH
jgi:hypothetical protein